MTFLNSVQGVKDRAYRSHNLRTFLLDAEATGLTIAYKQVKGEPGWM